MGVGRAVVDLMRSARPGCVVMPVNITSGQMQTEEVGYYGVPKRDLILGVPELGVLRIAAGLEHGPNLVQEMSAMQVKISPAGHEQFAVWREGVHDELVFAVAIAMLERAECVSERSGGRGAMVDEQARGGRGADISEEEG